MKKQTLIMFIGLLGAALLAGCSSQPTVEPSQPAMAPVAPAVAQAPMPAKADAVTPDDAAKADDVAKSDDKAQNDQMKQAQPNQQPQPPRQPQLIKITGTGFGSESSYEGYTPGQRRLMAIRASKLDAYRSLAEQLYGVKIDSNTQLSTLTARNDNFRARVNAIVKGARVVSVTPMPDNNYETILEVYVDRGFFNNHFVYTNCPNGSCNQEPVEASNLCGNGYNCQTVDGR
ncbi:LPP20 family lipoprotein [Hydrogenovibrio sp. JE_KL2]|uniref:LPP20 family lipoprotein n=1 Tax=Hydrogenovibrio sp. JE_KL2 TaxID=2651188 RepID=UPI0020A5A6FA|nr:LPP20 family lipoprotein [Hydrogenovibrio sp. JE_KL2]